MNEHSTSPNESPRLSTRSARLQAIERQLELTLDNLLDHVKPMLDMFLTEWSEPDSDLKKAEQLLSDALRDSKSWEWRDQLSDMKRQQIELKYPLRDSPPEPSSFKID